MDQRLTPHGPGFSFIDKVTVDAGGRLAVGEKWLDPAAPYFQDHFPGHPLMPGVLLIECAAQVAGALWQQASGRSVEATVFLASVQGFRFLKAVLPGQTIVTNVVLEKDFAQVAQFDAVLRVDGEVVAQGKVALSRKN